MPTPARLRGGALADVEDALAKRGRVAPELATELRAHSIATLAELRKTRGDRAGNRGPRCIMLAGYETPRDGGEGVFIWHDTLTTVDNAGQGAAGVVEVAGVEVGRWVRAQLYPTPAGVIGVRVLTSGTSYTPTNGTKDIILEMWGGGAAGGGAAATAAATSSSGSGGGSGSYLRKRITGLGAGPFTIAIGAGGTGVSGGTGNNGGSTTFNDGTTTYTAPGGNGGTTTGAGAPFIAQAGGAGAAVATNGDVNGFGAPGQMALVYQTTAAISGAGGSTSLGGAGAAVIGTGAGVAGNAAGANTGSGGSGAAGNNAAAQTGGAGAAGRIVITELG